MNASISGTLLVKFAPAIKLRSAERGIAVLVIDEGKEVQLCVGDTISLEIEVPIDIGAAGTEHP